MRHSSFQWVLALMMGISAALPLGCGSKSTPSSPSSSAPAPTFNYGLDIFFGSSGPSTLDGPIGIRLSGGTLWVSNYYENNLQAWTTAGSFSDVVTVSSASAILNPSSVGLGPDGYVYITETGNLRVDEFTPTGLPVTVFGNTQLGTDNPVGIAVNSSYAYLLDGGTPSFIRYTVTGSGSSKTFTSPVTFGTAATSGASGALIIPENLTLDSSGNVYIADNGKRGIMKYNSAGVFQAAVTSAGFAYPVDVQVDGSGYLFVADATNHNVQVFNPSGGAVTHFGDSTLTSPYGLVLDSSDNCYVIDFGGNRVDVFNRH